MECLYIALKNIIDMTLNPARTMTKLGLEESLEGCRKEALEAVEKYNKQKGE